MAISIVMLNADIKRGEKVLSAYMMFAPFVMIVVVQVVGWLARLGFSLSALLLSMLTNGLCLIALWLHYRRVGLSCQVFF